MNPDFSALKPGDRVMRRWGILPDSIDETVATVTKVTAARIYASHCTSLYAELCERLGQKASLAPAVYWRKSGKQVGATLPVWIEPIGT